jgi:hypothetical protein
VEINNKPCWHPHCPWLGRRSRYALSHNGSKSRVSKRETYSTLGLSDSFESTHESVQPSYRVLIDILLIGLRTVEVSGVRNTVGCLCHLTPCSSLLDTLRPYFEALSCAVGLQRTTEGQHDAGWTFLAASSIHHLGCGTLQSSRVERGLPPVKRISQVHTQVGAVAQK